MKLTLAHMIEKPKLNEEFRQWPLHITLVPWFNVKTSTNELISRLDTLLSQEDAFNVRGDSKIELGFVRKVSVFLLDDDTEVKNLHNRLLNTLKANQVDVDKLSRVGDKFMPHITDRKEDMHLSGVEFLIDSIDLVESISEWPHKTRKSIYRFEFKR